MFVSGPQPETSEFFFRGDPLGKEIQFIQKFHSGLVLLLGKL